MARPSTVDSVLARYRRDNEGMKGADNVNCMPLENGNGQFFPKLTFDGAYRRHRTDVTMVKNKPMNYR